jgi:hypothetical protein
MRAQLGGRVRRFTAGVPGAHHDDVEGPLCHCLLTDAEVLEHVHEQIFRAPAS